MSALSTAAVPGFFTTIRASWRAALAQACRRTAVEHSLEGGFDVLDQRADRNAPLDQRLSPRPVASERPRVPDARWQRHAVDVEAARLVADSGERDPFERFGER